MKALQLTGLMILIILINSSMIYSQDYLLYSSRKFAANVIVPQTRSFDIEKRGKVNIEGISVKVNIVDQVATTEIEISLNNPTRIRLEAEVILPVPESATVRGFDFQGKGLESSAVIMKKEDARKIYNGIVSKMKDPAILEFAGLSLIRSCVFPVESGSTQRVKLVYEELLLIDNNRVDYVLPRSESLSYSIPWEYKVTIKSKKKISTVYSPSHHIETSKSVDDTIAVNISKEAENNPGPLRISYLYKKNSVSASLITYPDSSIGGGYFLFLASPSSKPSDSEKILKRELTIVIDRSGSMRGKKIQQVTEVALQMISGLDNGEVFNVIVYNEGVDFFSDVAVEKNNSSVINVEKYLENIQPRGGTNIHEALVIALGKKPVGNYLPIVLFLTDGLPTIGQTSEKEIRKTVMKENPYNRRVFTIGVGVDVNT
ncbi:VWA domain-containing protein, partial [bacterium]|nr:VWA domain-containing protein [bacterium]